jgi:hypothetical protein
VRAKAVAHGIGAGLLAGLAGTAAMTASTKVEQRLRRRHAPPATAPVARRALGVERFESPRAEARFATLAHWAFGAGWGAAHGVLRAVGLGPRAATAAHYAALWGSGLVVLPSHDVVPPIFLRGRGEIAAEIWHNLLYAAATSAAFELLAEDG